MADSVNLILERMLPHLEELQHTGIFQEDEIRDIVKKRRQMEYQLFRRPPKKEDYLKAIEFEYNLDKLRKLRKEKMGVVGMSQDGEFGIINRITSLYRRATTYFKDDISLWLNHIDHCRCTNQHTMTSKLFGKALAIHPTNVGLWIMAAKFEFEERQDTTAARVLFQEGLRTNRESEKLWLEYYRLELLAVDKLRKRKNVLILSTNEEAPSDDVMDYAISWLVYNEAIKSIPDNASFRIAFLPILVQFEETHKREQEIYDNLLADFPNSGLVHDAVAKRNWLRINNEDSLPVSKVKELERETERLYREGIENLSRAEVPEEEEEVSLWEKYILWSVERLQYWNRKKGQANESGITKLLDICSKCSSKRKLNESLAVKMVKLLQTNGLHEPAGILVKEMVILFPFSCQLWLIRLHSEILNQANFETLSDLFHEAILSVKKEPLATQIWQLYINQVILRHSSSLDEIESVFQSCLQSLPSASSEPILLQYLDWVYISRGIKSIRNTYKKMSKDNQQSLSICVYMKLVSYEVSEVSINNRRIVDLFEAAINKYGCTSTDLWLEYIKTVTLLGSASEVSDLYWRATKTLDGGLIAQFMSRHSCLNFS
ncbi:PREDICTED: U3 small nucleolar RNA-associated protein 6 homolog isoform X2 [Amphimedon queenslandica]|uniref:U3 small nucleolar RNA-associated protein 6 homolog n=1 Tax=Amphimedon queenslandica TaxID=400682 RepID=A0AAN0J889_AMPQE|nr:PREDICTED: U3 small nucleolar RNA-associated protein 6 homolog isoform X2 [Amphimedon queenslandica]|eukprot:XP_019852946.1 PREDICTED: U3 small nucleolar RNA-associated protein 6 homolog isoform X2 [Amphimedon queenslandica]